MIGYFTLNPTPIDRLVWPEERISPFGQRISECGAMRLLLLQIYFQKDPSFDFKGSPCIYCLITLGFVKLTRVSNATIEAAIAGMYRQKSENVCGNTQVLLIRTRFIIWKQRNWTFFCFFDGCSQRSCVFYSDCFVDAKFDFIIGVFVRYERET